MINARRIGTRHSKGRLGVLALAAALAGAAWAETPAPARTLSIDLNQLKPSEAGCLVTFVAVNGLDRTLDKAAFEVVVFDGQGLVERMTVLDFRDLPAGRKKVRQFDLPGAACAGIGSILVNGAADCAGAGVEPGLCTTNLVTGSKSGIPLEN